MIISHIVAISKNNVIGKNNKLPWSLPADMIFFMNTTMEQVVIMGRKNYEAEGKPLKNRTNIVITRQKNYTAEGCIVVSSIEKAIEEARKYNKEEIFIIGGGDIYKKTLHIVDRIYLTIIETTIDGDVFYPQINREDWEEKSKRFYGKDKKNPFDHTYYVFEKKDNPNKQ